MPDLSSLDASELFHLAVEASRRDDHGVAITYLKQALDLPAGTTASSADYARMVYFLGAEYAQIGMMDRAQEQMARAVEMDPSLHTARFQLGLLLITRGLVDQSLEVLAPLATLGEDQPFFHLRAGLEHLVNDEFTPCRERLLKGMHLNQVSPDFNAALNGDMQKLLNALPAQDSAAPPQPENAEQDVEAGFAMSAYNRGQRTH